MGSVSPDINIMLSNKCHGAVYVQPVSKAAVQPETFIAVHPKCLSGILLQMFDPNSM